MSEAEKLKERILSDARLQREDILEKAQERAREIIARGEQEAEARRKDILEKARLQGEERRRRILTIAELDSRRALLTVKEELIEDTFQKALQRLQEMGQEAYQEIIYPMLLKAAQSGREEIIVSPRHREYFTPDFLKRVNQALAEQGKEGKLSLSEETRQMKGGFVLRAGDVEINNSFDSILRMQRDVLEPEVASILFGDQPGEIS